MYSCIAASLFNKLTYLLTYLTKFGYLQNKVTFIAVNYLWTLKISPRHVDRRDVLLTVNYKLDSDGCSTVN